MPLHKGVLRFAPTFPHTYTALYSAYHERLTSPAYLLPRFEDPARTRLVCAPKHATYPLYWRFPVKLRFLHFTHYGLPTGLLPCAGSGFRLPVRLPARAARGFTVQRRCGACRTIQFPTPLYFSVCLDCVCGLCIFVAITLVAGLPSVVPRVLRALLLLLRAFTLRVIVV